MVRNGLTHQAADNCERKKKQPKHQVSDQAKNEVINVENTARNIKQETVDISFSFKTFSKFVFFSPWLSKPGSKY